MNLYLVFAEHTSYDEYDTILVAAGSVADALGYVNSRKIFNSPSQGEITVKLIGTAVPGVQEGEVMSSFNAG